MNKKKTEKARVLAGVEFGKWLFMGGAEMSYLTIMMKLDDTMRAYGLEINNDNWVAVGRYSKDFLLSMFEAVRKE